MSYLFRNEKSIGMDVSKTTSYSQEKTPDSNDVSLIAGEYKKSSFDERSIYSTPIPMTASTVYRKPPIRASHRPEKIVNLSEKSNRSSSIGILDLNGLSDNSGGGILSFSESICLAQNVSLQADRSESLKNQVKDSIKQVPRCNTNNDDGFNLNQSNSSDELERTAPDVQLKDDELDKLDEDFSDFEFNNSTMTEEPCINSEKTLTRNNKLSNVSEEGQVSHFQKSYFSENSRLHDVHEEEPENNENDHRDVNRFVAKQPASQLGGTINNDYYEPKRFIPRSAPLSDISNLNRKSDIFDNSPEGPENNHRDVNRFVAKQPASQLGGNISNDYYETKRFIPRSAPLSDISNLNGKSDIFDNSLVGEKENQFVPPNQETPWKTSAESLNFSKTFGDESSSFLRHELSSKDIGHFSPKFNESDHLTQSNKTLSNYSYTPIASFVNRTMPDEKLNGDFGSSLIDTPKPYSQYIPHRLDVEKPSMQNYNEDVSLKSSFPREFERDSGTFPGNPDQSPGSFPESPEQDSASDIDLAYRTLFDGEVQNFEDLSGCIWDDFQKEFGDDKDFFCNDDAQQMLENHEKEFLAENVFAEGDVCEEASGEASSAWSIHSKRTLNRPSWLADEDVSSTLRISIGAFMGGRTEALGSLDGEDSDRPDFGTLKAVTSPKNVPVQMIKPMNHLDDISEKSEANESQADLTLTDSDKPPNLFMNSPDANFRNSDDVFRMTNLGISRPLDISEMHGNGEPASFNMSNRSGKSMMIRDLSCISSDSDNSFLARSGAIHRSDVNYLLSKVPEGTKPIEIADMFMKMSANPPKRKPKNMQKEMLIKTVPDKFTLEALSQKGNSDYQSHKMSDILERDEDQTHTDNASSKAESYQPEHDVEPERDVQTSIQKPGNEVSFSSNKVDIAQKSRLMVSLSAEKRKSRKKRSPGILRRETLDQSSSSDESVGSPLQKARHMKLTRKKSTEVKVRDVFTYPSPKPIETSFEKDTGKINVGMEGLHIDIDDNEFSSENAAKIGDMPPKSFGGWKTPRPSLCSSRRPPRTSPRYTSKSSPVQTNNDSRHLMPPPPPPASESFTSQTDAASIAFEASAFRSTRRNDEQLSTYQIRDASSINFEDTLAQSKKKNDEEPKTTMNNPFSPGSERSRDSGFDTQQMSNLRYNRDSSFFLHRNSAEFPRGTPTSTPRNSDILTKSTPALDDFGQSFAEHRSTSDETINDSRFSVSSHDNSIQQNPIESMMEHSMTSKTVKRSNEIFHDKSTTSQNETCSFLRQSSTPMHRPMRAKISEHDAPSNISGLSSQVDRNYEFSEIDHLHDQSKDITLGAKVSHDTTRNEKQERISSPALPPQPTRLPWQSVQTNEIHIRPENILSGPPDNLVSAQNVQDLLEVMTTNGMMHVPKEGYQAPSHSGTSIHSRPGSTISYPNRYSPVPAQPNYQQPNEDSEPIYPLPIHESRSLPPTYFEKHFEYPHQSVPIEFSSPQKHYQKYHERGYNGDRLPPMYNTAPFKPVNTKLEVASDITFPEVACVSSSQQLVTSIRNLENQWLQCSLNVVSLTIDGYERNPMMDSPFLVKPQIILEPTENDELKVIFAPRCAGLFEAKVHIVLSAIVSHLPMQPDRIPTVITIRGAAELPNLQIITGQENCIDFGEISWGSYHSLPVTFVNYGQCDVPLRMLIGNSNQMCSFTFERQLSSSCADQMTSRSDLYTGSKLTNTCVVRGKKGMRDESTRTTVHIHFKSPEVESSRRLSDVMPLDVAGNLSIQIETQSVQMPISNLLLRARVGTVRLHAPHCMQTVRMKAKLGVTSRQIIPFRNAGNIKMTLSLEILDKDGFSVSPSTVEIEPGNVSEAIVRFIPLNPGKSRHSTTLAMFIQPDGPAYEMSIEGETVAYDATRMAKVSDNDLLVNKGFVSWGGVKIGGSDVQKLVIKNVTNYDLTCSLDLRRPCEEFEICDNIAGKDIVFKPNETIPIYIKFSPTAVTSFTNKLTVKRAGNWNKYAIPLMGYGGTSNINVTNASSHDVIKGTNVYNVYAINVKPKKVSLNILCNTGDRPAYVKLICFSDVDCQTPVPIDLLTVQPCEFVLRPQENKTVMMVFHPTDLSLFNSGIPEVAYVHVFYGDELMRSKFRSASASEKAVKPKMKCPTPVKKVNFDVYYKGEEAVVSDVQHGPNDADLFYSTMRTIVLSLNHDAPSEDSFHFSTMDILNETPVNMIPPSGHYTTPPVKGTPASGSVSSTLTAQTLFENDNWCVSPRIVTLSCNRRDEISRSSFEIINTTDEVQKFDLLWPGHVFTVKPEEGIIHPRCSEKITVMVKPSDQLFEKKSPWVGEVVVKCASTQKAVKVTIESCSMRKAYVSQKENIPSHGTLTSVASHKENKPSGIFSSDIKVKTEDLVFPVLSPHKTELLKVEVKNCSSTTRRVAISVNEPFYTRCAKIDIKAKHFIKIPVEFKPKSKGYFDGNMALKVDNETISIPMSGLCE